MRGDLDFPQYLVRGLAPIGLHVQMSEGRTCLLPVFRAFIVWLANGDTLRVFKMTKREDGGYTFTATPEDFPKKHKAPVIDIGIADTGKRHSEGGTRPGRRQWPQLDVVNDLMLPLSALCSAPA